MVLPGAERRGQRDQGSRRLLEGREGRVVSDPAAEAYLRRAIELARRGLGSTSPNPSVGAVLARDGTTLGEGFHRARGEAHAEVEALRDAAQRGHDVRGATAYVSLEPCNHTGLTPPCSEALIAAGIVRVVVGTLDPNPRTAGGGIGRLRAAGLVVEIADDAGARSLVEEFDVAVRSARPYVRLKMAASLDGRLSPEPGRFRVTGDAAREYVRDLRSRYDAVLVGAGTLRTDDPQLTLRPPRSRRRPYHRAVLCGAAPPLRSHRIFARDDGYARATLLVPAEAEPAYATLADVADVVAIPRQAAHADAAGARLDLAASLGALYARGIASLLCEGGAHLAASLLAAGFVDRVDWLLAPRFLSAARSVPALAGADLAGLPPLRFDRIEALGEDLLLSARIGDACLAD